MNTDTSSAGEYFPGRWADGFLIVPILQSLGADADTILAGLLLSLPKEGREEKDKKIIEKYGGSEVVNIMKGVEKVSYIEYQGEKNADIIRRFLLSEIDDVRVLYIRIARRIALLQKIKQFPDQFSVRRQDRYIKGALSISLPLLVQLGLYSFKMQLEDLCFELQYPKEYQKLYQQIQEQKEKGQQQVKDMIEELKLLFIQKNIPLISIKGRDKGVFSLWKKIQQKEYESLSEVNDILALRIILPTEQDCYQVLSELHSEKEFFSEHFIDYIASPKPNGYRSIHTTVQGFLGVQGIVEIQIRTAQMDYEAEMGASAHWEYKNETTLGKNINISAMNSSSRDMNRFDYLKQQLQNTPKIYPITPTGEIKELPKGATPIDFAYTIHSTIGEKCSGALVNEKIFPISGELQTGDMVELFTSAQKTPKAEWLNFVVSTSAKHKIQNFLNRNSTVPFPEKQKVPLPNKTPLREKNNSERLIKDLPLVCIGGEKGIPHHFAKCCHPEESTEIIAYSSSTRDFVIHTPSCTNLKNLDSSRLMEAKFV